MRLTSVGCPAAIPLVERLVRGRRQVGVVAFEDRDLVAVACSSSAASMPAMPPPTTAMS
ncbi:MAG: hypothetical protein R2715_23945 [Ilumatobacteraceae bacterium]